MIDQDFINYHSNTIVKAFTESRIRSKRYMTSEQEIQYHKPQFFALHIPSNFIDSYLNHHVAQTTDEKNWLKQHYGEMRVQVIETIQTSLKIPIIHTSSSSNNGNNGNNTTTTTEEIDFSRKRFVVISDSHAREKNWYEKIPSGDVLLHCGDFSGHGNLQDVEQFNELLGRLKMEGKFKQIVCIAGNHDYMLDPKYNKSMTSQDLELIYNSKKHPLLTHCDYYLQNSSIILDGAIKIFGSPVTSHGMAFHASTETSFKIWSQQMDQDADIVMTHVPPYNILDLAGVNAGNPNVCPTCSKIHPNGSHWGDFWMKNQLIHRVKPKISVFGHVHQGCGFVRLSLQQLKSDEEHQKKIFQVNTGATNSNGITNNDSQQSITFLNAAIDMTHKCYFFDYFYYPQSRNV